MDFLNYLPWWVWTIDVILFILAWISYGFRAPQASAILLTLAALVSLAFSSVHPMQWVFENWDKTIEFVGIWFAIGIIWAFVRWQLYLHSSTVKQIVLTANGLWKTDSNRTTSFKDSHYYPFGYRKDSGRIITWVVFWPFSIVWYFLSEFLSNAFTHLGKFLEWSGKAFSNLFGAMADNRVDKILNESDKK